MNETVLSRNGKFLLNLHRVVSLQCLLPGRDQDSGSEPGLQGVGLEVMGFPVEPASAEADLGRWVTRMGCLWENPTQ